MAPTFKEVYPENSWSNWDTSQQDPVFYYEEPAVSLRETYGDNRGNFYDWATKAVKTWDTPQLVRVSENKVKYIKKNPNCKHISEFFLQINEKGGYTMDDSMITWFTSTKLEKIADFKFLSSFKSINPGLHKIYERVIEARENSFEYYRHRNLESTDVYKQAEKLMEFQMYCKEIEGEANAAELISNKSKELFVLSDIGECVGVNMEIIDMYNNILEFSEDVKHLFRAIEGMDNNLSMTLDLEKEILSYLACKGKDQWDTSTCLPTESEPTQENQ